MQANNLAMYFIKKTSLRNKNIFIFSFLTIFLLSSCYTSHLNQLHINNSKTSNQNRIELSQLKNLHRQANRNISYNILDHEENNLDSAKFLGYKYLLFFPFAKIKASDLSLLLEQNLEQSIILAGYYPYLLKESRSAKISSYFHLEIENFPAKLNVYDYLYSRKLFAQHKLIVKVFRDNFLLAEKEISSKKSIMLSTPSDKDLRSILKSTHNENAQKLSNFLELIKNY